MPLINFSLLSPLSSLSDDDLTRRQERLAAYARAGIPVEIRFAQDAGAFAREIIRRKFGEDASQLFARCEEPVRAAALLTAEAPAIMIAAHLAEHTDLAVAIDRQRCRDALAAAEVRG